MYDGVDGALRQDAPRRVDVSQVGLDEFAAGHVLAVTG